MSRICQITGKRAMRGNNVSHSKRRTKRTFDV
ncbi:MAG: 50S ribosomal protein L28, partial [Bacteroidales bacterium]|nr:50S ribosomal protein L28 [Bacteroidales bacterium]MDD6554512.1 50S ribosomal protein L28 [Bacteroidales bacterium]